MLSVSLQQQWSLEAPSSSSSWLSRTTARLCSNPWSMFICFSSRNAFNVLNIVYVMKQCPLVPLFLRSNCPLISNAPLGRVHCLWSSLFMKKQFLLYRVKAWVPFQHKTPTWQLSTSTDFLFASHHLLTLLTTSISFPHSPLWLYQIAFISAQPWYSIEGRHHSAVSEPNVSQAFHLIGLSGDSYHPLVAMLEVLSPQATLAVSFYDWFIWSIFGVLIMSNHLLG